MCGRYTYFVGEFSNLRILWNLDRDLPRLKPRYNIAPGQEAPVIASLDGGRACRLFQWGLIPFWAKDPSIGNKMINARAETLAEKPSFKRIIGRKRCLVLADGFYEWRREGKRKVPIRLRLKSGEIFTMAGLWDTWKKPDGTPLNTFTIVTTEPNDLLKPIHNRMPVMLNNDEALKWLDTEEDLGRALSLLKPYPAGEMEGDEVSTLVNNPRNDSPACVEPVGKTHFS